MKINYRESPLLSLFAGKRTLDAADDIRTIHSTSDETKTYVKGSYKEFANSYHSVQDGPTNKLR
jgi:hypothetical protein